MTLLPNAETHHIEVGSAMVAYHDSLADAPAILLVHGTGGTMERHFGRLIPMLASKYRVIGIDLGTSLTDERLELDDYVAQVEAVVDHANLAQADLTILGYSLGAVVAAAYAARSPEHVDRLVLASGWPKTDANQRLRNEIWRQLYEAQSSALPRFSVLTAYGPRHLGARTQAEIDALVAGSVPDEERARQMDLNARIDITSELAQITAPTLIVQGEDDAMVPVAHAYTFLGGIEQSRLAVISAGHAVFAERPAQVFSLVDQFARDRLPTPVGEQYEHPIV